MGCQKCETTPVFPKDFGKIIVFANHDYMLAKLYSNFNGLFQMADHKEYLEVFGDFEEFIQKVGGLRVFSQVELENILVTVLEREEVPTYTTYKKFKTLDYWITLYNFKDLKWILDNRSIITYFQPIFDIRKNEIYGYECLSRGIREDGSIMPPNVMFDAAKKTDMLFNLDRQCRLAALRHAKDKNISKNIFINFTPTAIYNPEFCLRDTVKMAQELSYSFDRIVFEVVESERLDNISHLKTIFDFYIRMGFRVALDDVGSGYSSLNMLAQLRPHFVKIDMELIRDIHNDSTKKVIVSSLCRIAKEIGSITLAEGIEVEEELNVVKELGIDLAQGYLLGKPLKDI